MNLLNDARVIIRKTLANGDELVCGDKENPVTISAEKLTPSSPSGFSGVRYMLGGLMTHFPFSLLPELQRSSALKD